jgi:hypothetical protein
LVSVFMEEVTVAVVIAGPAFGVQQAS